MHYSPDCLCESCKRAGNRRYIGGGVYNINNKKNNMTTKDVIDQAEKRLSNLPYSNHVVNANTLKRFVRLDYAKLIFYDYTKDLLQSVVDEIRQTMVWQITNDKERKYFDEVLSDIIKEIK